jgi:hypothetical protein
MKTKTLFIKFSLCLLFIASGYAQKSKTYTESFNVNKDTEVSLKADNAEIIIETWNKDRVDVEATITVDVEDEKLADEILENFEFEALGNSKKVEIRAGRHGSHVFAMMNDLHFFPGGGDVEILTHDIKGLKIPPPPPVPPMPEMNFDFDMEKFNEEGKAYIIRFQDEVKDIVNDSTFKKEMKEWKIKLKQELRKSGMKDSVEVFTYTLKGDYKDKKDPKNAKVVKGFRAPKPHLRSHPQHKVKKKIIIKMPKDAKLDLDVKRSELKIASLYQIDANLNYSGLQIDELTGENSSVSAIYSGVNITKANGLNLNLKYAKKVKIGEVNQLISTSKTSNLVIDLVNQKAIIDGSFGDLVIKDISKDFKLIDINLKNSSAKLKVPDVAYNFYINSKSSDLNLNSKLDYKVSEAFDSKIYQNKNSQNTSRVLNIKADYSNFELY